MKKRQIMTFLLYSLSFFWFVGFWQALAFFMNSPLILPYPFDVFKTIIKLANDKTFLQYFFVTVQRCFYSFAISFFLGTILGCFCGSYKIVKVFFSFPLAIIRTTPVVSVILIALFWFKSSTIPIFVSVLMTLPIIITSVSIGFEKTDKNLLNMAKVYCFSRYQIFKFIKIPSVLPFLLSASLSSFSLTWKVVVAGEILSLPKKAVGTLLQTSQMHLETQEVIAISLILVLVSFFMEKIASFILKTFKKCLLILSHTRRLKQSYIPSRIAPSFKASHSESVKFSLQDVSIKRKEKTIYNNFNLSVEKSTVLALIAPSGAGKTTLLNFIAELFSKKDETVEFDGEIIFDSVKSLHRPKVSYMFQQDCLIPTLSVLQNIMLPLENFMEKSKALEIANFYLEKTLLKDKSSSLPTALSGGEKQRVCLARAFAFPSKILLLDEPFQSQDVKTKSALMELFLSMQNGDERTVVFVTHDIRETIKIADRIVVLTSNRPNTQLRIVLDIKNKPTLKNYYDFTLEELGLERTIAQALIK